MRLHLIILLFVCLFWKSKPCLLQAHTNFLLEPQRIPDDLNLMPALSNGHLGFTIFGDAIYINGVYNGHTGDSRRARLPNWLNITGLVVDPETNRQFQYTQIKYTMDLYNGVYEWTENYENLNLSMKQGMYAHRYFNRALIYEIFIQRETASSSLTIQLQQKPGVETQAFDLKTDYATGNNIRIVRATTKVVENVSLQPSPTTVYVAFSDDFLGNKKILQMISGQKVLYYRFIITVDLHKSVALKELGTVLSLKRQDVFSNHISRWQKFWNDFQITVEGDKELSQTINAGIFYLANSLPSLETNQENNPYFGLSPTGLGRGQSDDDYQGHNFWDTEIWMLPAVTELQTNWSLDLFKYRVVHLQGALSNANLTGYKGARFPWESAYTGTEVTNPCCPEVAAQEIHISADIAVALQQFYATSYSRDWLCSTAWPLVREIAKFLEDRVSWDERTETFHVQNVMGPDEDHENIDDNVYTNVAFKKAFEFARFTHLECDPSANVSSLEWLNIANKIVILYDAAKDYHPQHLGYRAGEEVKQADTILLGYPLQYPMENSTRFNDLQMYENVTRHSGPAMTWSMFAINYLDIGLPIKAEEYFKKSYRNYVQPDFKVWSETKIGLKGSANFLTGIGGFLQAILYGYAGIRFQLENNSAKMVFKHSYLIPHTSKLCIRGIKFANALFQLIIEKNKQNTLKVLKMGDQPLEIIFGSSGQRFNLYEGFSIKAMASKVSSNNSNNSKSRREYKDLAEEIKTLDKEKIDAKLKEVNRVLDAKKQQLINGNLSYLDYVELKEELIRLNALKDVFGTMSAASDA